MLKQQLIKLVNYRKYGGLHFVNIGRFGVSFYVKSTAKKPEQPKGQLSLFG
jgi:hypothetical protein